MDEEGIRIRARLEVFREIHKITYDEPTAANVIVKIGELYGTELKRAHELGIKIDEN